MFTWVKRPRPPKTFDELLQKFQEIHLPVVSENTRIRYRLDIESRIRPAFGSYRFNEIDRLQIEAFRAKLTETLSPKSVNNCTALLNLIFSKGVEWKIVDTNPFALKLLKIPERSYPWWDDKEHIKKFLAEAKKSRHYAAYLLALECGMRLGEIVGLDKSGVDLQRKRIHVTQQWLERLKKPGPTKGRNIRFINYDPGSELHQALEEMIRLSTHPEAVFVTSAGNRIHPTLLRCKLMPTFIRKAGVPAITFHDLRHTFASWYMLEHDDIWTLMRLLGHSDIQMTQKYAHLSKENLKAHSLKLSEANTLTE